MKRWRTHLREIASRQKSDDGLKPWAQFLLNLANLCRVKAIISLVIVFIFAYKVFSGAEIGIEFLTIFTVVVTYWLCEKTKKGDDEE